MELGFKLFAELSRLGVTQVTLTKDAMDKLQESIIGLWQPGPDDLTAEELKEIDVGWAGTLAGVKFYREIKG